MKWFSQFDGLKVILTENVEPANDDNQRYKVACELIFEPLDPRCAYVEIWITEDGDVGIGFERWSRLAARLNRNFGGIDRFVCGCEPGSISLDQAMTVLRLISMGWVYFCYLAFPIFGLIDCRCAVSSKDLSAQLPFAKNLSYAAKNRKPRCYRTLDLLAWPKRELVVSTIGVAHDRPTQL